MKKNKSARTTSKHQASKSKFQHKRGYSKGELKDMQKYGKLLGI